MADEYSYPGYADLSWVIDRIRFGRADFDRKLGELMRDINKAQLGHEMTDRLLDLGIEFLMYREESQRARRSA